MVIIWDLVLFDDFGGAFFDLRELFRDLGQLFYYINDIFKINGKGAFSKDQATY